MEQVKYIGMDVHLATTVIAVLDGSGKLIMESIIETQAATLLAFLRGLRGSLQVTFEEGTYAAWLYDLIAPRVARVVVSDPRQNALLKSGNKNDRLDARKLAELLRAGLLQPVYHGQRSLRALKELARSYVSLVQDATRVMNRLKALYRGRGIGCAGSRVYAPPYRERWLEQLREPGVQRRAERLYQQLDSGRALVREARQDLLAESRKHAATKILRGIPFLGPIRVALLLAVVETPHRFRSKRQFWSYAGLGLVTRTSAEYRFVGPQRVRSGRPALVRGLNQNHNHLLKEIFKGAAAAASFHRGPLREFYQQRLAAGIKPELARLTLARKLAALTLHLWKKGERYQPEQLNRQAA